MFDYLQNNLSLKLSSMASEGGRAFRNARADFRKIPGGLNKFGKHIGGIPRAIGDTLHNTGFRLGDRASDYVVGNKPIGRMLDSGISASTEEGLEDVGFGSDYRKNRKIRLDRFSQNRNLQDLRGKQRFIKASNISRLEFVRNRAMNNLSKVAMRSFGVTTARGVGQFALRAAGPIGALTTAMSVGQYFVDSSFDRTSLQSDIKGLTDMFVSEAPTLLSVAAFGAAESAISGKFTGSAGGFLSKRLGGGGGWKGKAVSMVGGFAAYALSSSVLKPVQEALGGAVSSARTTGLMSSIVKGSVAESEAAIRKMAKEKGIISEYGIQEFAKTLKAPEGVGKMNTKQIQLAQRELQTAQRKIDGGFWNAAFNSNVMQWTAEMENDKALSTIRQELRDRNVNFQQAIKDNSDAVIDFYSRE